MVSGNYIFFCFMRKLIAITIAGIAIASCGKQPAEAKIYRDYPRAHFLNFDE